MKLGPIRPGAIRHMAALAPLIVELLALGERVRIAFVRVFSGLVKFRHRVRDCLIRQGLDGERTVVERTCECDRIGACQRPEAAQADGACPTQQAAKVLAAS